MNVKYLGSALTVGSFVALGVACGDSTANGGAGGSADVSTSSSGSTTTKTTTTTTTASMVTTPSSSGSTGGDGNDTIDTAEAMTDMDGILVGTGDLAPADTDVDFFKFSVAAAGPVLIQVRRSDFSDLAEDDIDPYLTLYNTAKEVYAINDDRYPRSDKQSEILTYLPAAGEYYLKLQEWCTSDTMDPTFCNADYFNGIVNNDFAVYVIPMVAGTDYDAETGEPNNTQAAATEITASPVTGMPGSYYLGIAEADFQAAADEDWYTVTIPDDLATTATERPNLGILFPWGGIDGNGSKARPGAVDIVDAAAPGTVVARLDFTAEPKNPFDRAEFSVPVAKGGTYLIKVKDGGMEADGAGTFYFTYRTMGAGNPIEAQEVPNNVAATAETLASNPVTGGFGYFIEGNLLAGDTDHFKVAVQGQTEVSVACGAQRSGSGLRGLTATVLQSDGATEVGAATETATTNLQVDSEPIPSGQTDLIVRLTATQDGTVTGNYYRCGIYVQTP